MVIRRIVLFLSLVVLCVAASSINLNQSTRLKYMEFQWLAQNGEPARAEAGFRILAMKYPYTVAGIESVRRLVSDGESLPRLTIEILDAGIRSTTAAEWLVFLSAFFVVTVFMAGNSLPPVILLPFVISGAGMFHLSHPLISIHSNVLDTLLTVNLYIYTALTLLIAGGYLHRRWRPAGPSAYRNRKAPAGAGIDLTLSEQLLMRNIYLEKLKALQMRAKELEGELRSPHGRHFVSELNRIFDTMQNEYRIISGELESSEAQHQKILQDSERTIDRAKDELKEIKILLKSKAIDREEYKRLHIEKESTIKKCRQRISEANAKERKTKRVHLRNRVQFMRRDLFLVYLHNIFINKQQSAMKVVQGQGLFDPKIARNDLRQLKFAERKRTDVDAKIKKLEQRREKMTGPAYREKKRSLLNEKKVREKALAEVIDKISGRMDLCKNKKERMESAIQTLSDELADMKTLGKIRRFFPVLVRVQRSKIRKALKYGRKALPCLYKIEAIYNGASFESPEPV